MKYLTLYENFLTNLFNKKKKVKLKFEDNFIEPNLTDKQYWVFNGKFYGIFILKFTHEEDLLPGIGGEYHFISILGDDFEFNDKYYEKGIIMGKNIFVRGEIPHEMRNGNLRLATSEEIEEYSIYFDTNKFNI